MTNYIEFAYFFDAKNSLPNGDPDAGNAPRQDYTTGLGWVSDVCIKRKVRNYVDMVRDGAPNRIYVTENAILDDKHKEAYEANGIEGGKASGKADDLTKWMCGQYYDVRMMGALMVGDLNCGKVRGPLQISMAESLDPIEPVQLSITRMAATKASEVKEGEREKDNKTMGNKWVVPYAAYRLNGTINGGLAEKTGATEADIDLLWEALREMWHYDKSAVRPEMAARSLVVVRHPGTLRTAGTPPLDELVKIERLGDGPVRSWDRYGVNVRRGLLPEGVEVVEMIGSVAAAA